MHAQLRERQLHCISNGTRDEMHEAVHKGTRDEIIEAVHKCPSSFNSVINNSAG